MKEWFDVVVLNSMQVSMYNSYHFQESELVNVRREVFQVIVSHVQSSETATEVGKISRERGTDKIVVREI